MAVIQGINHLYHIKDNGKFSVHILLNFSAAFDKANYFLLETLS